MKSILIVCEGNICRSPMAEGLLGHAVPHLRVRSAGLSALSGMPADDLAIHLMRSRGIDISAHRAVQVNRAMCEQADLVLVMSSEQRKKLENAYPTTCGRVFRVGEFTKEDVPDPYGQSEERFRHALAVIDAGMREWLHRLKRIQPATR